MHKGTIILAPPPALRRADSVPGMRASFTTELTSFLNTFKAIPTPNMLMSFSGQMRSEASDAMWKLVNKTPISLHETAARRAALFYTDFVPTPGAAVQHARYFSHGAATGAGSPGQHPKPTMRGETGATRRTRRRLVSDGESDGEAAQRRPMRTRVKMKAMALKVAMSGRLSLQRMQEENVPSMVNVPRRTNAFSECSVRARRWLPTIDAAQTPNAAPGANYDKMKDR